MGILFGMIIPYMVILIFLAGTILSVMSWLNIPVPFILTVFPCPKNRGEAVLDLVRESIGFTTLWRANKNLWFMALLFHLSLGLVVIGHFFGIGFLGLQFTWLGAAPEKSMQLSALFGTYAGFALLLGVLLLFMRRISSPIVRRISSFADYLLLLLLLGIIISGMYMRLFQDLSYEPVQKYLVGLLTFRYTPIPDNPAFILHFTLVQLLLLYFPYSKLVHSCGLYISRWLMIRPHTRQVIIK